MKKNTEQNQKRNDFIKEAMNDPKEAGRLLAVKAVGLMNCRNTTDTIFAIKDILFLSESTIVKEARK